MIQKVEEKVGKVGPPSKINWAGQEHEIIKLGFHHTFREGRTLQHVFSVASKNLFFKLVLDSESLIWTLVSVADGEVN